MRKIALTIIPLLLLACGREPAAPALPQLSADRRTDILNIPDIVVGSFVGSCQGFDVLSDWTADFRAVTVYDNGGNLDRNVYLYHLRGQSTYYNSVHPDMAVYGGPGESQNAIWDYDRGLIVVAGPVWRIVLPGIGPIFMDVGEVTLDLATFTITHSGGHHQYWESDFGALCNALTP